MLEVLVLALDQLQLRPQLGDRLPQGLQLRGRAEGLESSLGQEVVLDGQLALEVRHERVVEAGKEEAGVRVSFISQYFCFHLELPLCVFLLELVANSFRSILSKVLD